jgi:hypothetical protein
MSSGGNRRINTSTECEIIEGVTVDVKARVVTVKGKRGSLTRDFKHLNVEIYKAKNAKTGKEVIMVSLSLCLCWCFCSCYRLRPRQRLGTRAEGGWGCSGGGKIW